MHYFSPFYSPFPAPMLFALIPLIIIGALWTVAIKGYALWHAARNGQKEWFLVLLVVNTIGILEVVYLLWFRPGSTPRATSSHSPAPEVSSEPRE